MKKTTTNINILDILSLTGLKSMSPYILFGLYYGFLATLPVGPSQILCIRAFLLGGNRSGLVSLSGSMLAQLVTISSIYCSPIYILLSKPHLLTVAAIPYTVAFCLTMNDLPNYQILRPVNSLRDSRVISLFFNSFLFQILNPVLLPNPVLARLTHLFFFRYSNNLIFVVTSFLGWLTGHMAFSYLSKLLLIRVKKDSPIIYLLVKRAIYTTFSIVFVANALIYLGRAPVSFWTVKFMNEPHDKEMSFWEIAEYPDFLWWFFKPWPTSFFDPSRGNRGNRFIRNSRSDINSSFYKGKISTYFFKKCLSDGKQRLCIATLPSLSIFEKQLEKSLTITRSHKFERTHFSYRGWILKKLVKNRIFQKELLNRVKLLDTGFSFSKAMERKIRLIARGKKRVPHVYDPFVTNLRVRIPVPQTFLTVDELDLTIWNWNELETRKKIRKGRGGSITKKNSIEDWISAENQKLKQGSRNPMPWETLPVRAQRMFQFMFKNRVLYDYDVQKILKKIKSPSGPVVTWEEIMNLDPEDRALFLTYITQEENCYKFDQIFLSKIFSISGRRRPSTPRKGVCTLHKIDDLGANLARSNELYFDTEFDFPGADGDIRHRKLRNVGFTFAKGKPRSTKLVKRYARISDFRRKFLKGSMRSRRRKTLLWKTLQEKVRSAFFLRLVEIPILLQLPVEQLTGSETGKLLTGSKKITGYQFGQQLTPFSLTGKTSSQSKLARSAVAARSDIGPIHNGRGYMLVFQSRFRKFVKLPVLIVSKTIGRILLRQNSEWNKDWMKWKKEIHINCTFDGEEFSQDQLPPRWLREGIQVKIAYPFRLKPWHSAGKKKRLTPPRKKYMEAELIEDRKSTNKQKLKQKRPRFTYLTALGYQTDIPFGSIQKQPSFWKPVRKELIQICKDNFSLRTKQAYRFLDSKFNLGKMLKPSLILLRKFNLFFKPGGVSADFVSTYNTRIKPVLSGDTDEVVKINSNFDKINGRSVNIVGEVQPVSNINKQLVTQKSTSKEFVADNDITGLSNPLDEGVNVDQPDTETTQVGKLTLDYRLEDTDLSNSIKFDEEELKGFKEIILKLHVVVAEAVEKFISAASISYLKVNRDFYYYFGELVSLRTQLVEVINITLQETDVAFFRPKDRLSQFDKTQSLSQAYLYKSIWDLSAEENLNLKLLATGSGSNCGGETENSGNWSDSLTPYQPEQSLAYSENSSGLFVGYDSTISSLSEMSNCTDISFGKATSKIAKKFYNEHVLNCIEEWGLLKKLRDLDASNWNKWLDCFSNCNLPLTLWRDVAPHRWKISFDCLDELSHIEEEIASERKCHVLRDELHNYSIYARKPLLRDRIINLSKLRKRRYLLQSFIDFVRNGDVQKFSMRQDAIAQRFHCKTRISKITKVRRRGVNRLPNLCTSDSEITLNSKFDLMPWLVTDFGRTKSSFKKKTRRSGDPILKDNTTYGIVLDITRRFQKVSDELYEIMLDEREDMDYLFRWKWKSETKLENLRSLTALTRMLGDDRDLVTLCANTNVDSELLDLYFNATTKLGLFYDLSILSAHRLSILLDDQNLVYKIMNPLLKFKSRLKGRVGKQLYRKIYSDTYISKLSLIATEVNKRRSHIYNIEDLLLARRRREFRFLRSLLISRSSKPGAQHYFDLKFDSISKVERTRSSEECEPSELREVQRVKRFLWPSHRLEELACTGRFCFNIITGSRFAILKIQMYPIIRN
uniref:Protein TIC 214 n=1 Tax=Dryopteris yoroii TaxID=2982183 RepID=A0A977SP17_9MONI|nr:Ycf1 [Dryopteris yoroii]UXN85079.1 Ycf1 [Dryopteris yoroii]UXN85255.1 Ycf1 [Dryopteris yoroii]UXN85343.1 Ycf1 [Dryopteris yoroii]